MIPVKICGITREEDARLAGELGALAIGFIFHEKSERYIPPDQARIIGDSLRNGIRKVGVFVNESSERVNRIADKAGLEYVQLHGNESPGTCRAMNRPVIKAFRVGEDFDFSRLEPYDVYAFLLDTYVEGTPGGTGESFDWESVDTSGLHRPVILAGGLHTDNVREAIDRLHPDALDVSSGVEDSPGIKSREKMKDFFSMIQSTSYTSAVFSDPKSSGDPAYIQPDSTGHYGEFGGKYVPETLIPALEELESTYLELRDDTVFLQELNALHDDYTGRPSKLTYAPSLSKDTGYEIYLKREDLNHTGAHKINNTLGQILLAKKMGKNRIIAETGAGQHGVATATVAAKFGLDCVVYMGEEDIRRQQLNVFRMELLGAEVRTVTSGSKTLKDATNEALRDWVANVEDTYYLIGSVVGPHPYPMIVRDFQTIIGRETKDQFRQLHGRLPDALIACVGGGSNAIGMFHPFLDDDVKLYGVEAAGRGVDTPEHAATIGKGTPGVFHGAASYLLQNDDGQIQLAHSVSAGLDYPGIGPEHSYLSFTGRVRYLSATDADAVRAFQWLARREGIIPALESAHALAVLQENQLGLEEGTEIVVCLSGRGDKDVQTVAEYLGRDVE